MLRELREVKIHTVGDLAKLTEEQLDRLRVKPPKRTNVFCVLEVTYFIYDPKILWMPLLNIPVTLLLFAQDFEKQHSSLLDGVDCSKFHFKSALIFNELFI